MCKEVLMSKAIRCGSVMLLAVVAFNCLFMRGLNAQDRPVIQPDHPLVVATVASVDRLLDRAVDVIQTSGAAITRDEVFKLIS